MPEKYDNFKPPVAMIVLAPELIDARGAHPTAIGLFGPSADVAVTFNRVSRSKSANGGSRGRYR